MRCISQYGFQSTRPLRGATYDKEVSKMASKFQSTRPLRGATPELIHDMGVWLRLFQSTRPLRGATIAQGNKIIVKSHISIHAPLTGRDCVELVPLARSEAFQSTRPLRGATGPSGGPVRRRRISIHAPLTGRDTTGRVGGTGMNYFNPRAPYGARQCNGVRGEAEKDFNPRAPYGARQSLLPRQVKKPRFQSTRPLRGATAKMHK